MDTVVGNLKESEDIFHQLVHRFYKKYNSFYRPKLTKALNTSTLTNVVEKSGIIPKCERPPFLVIQVKLTNFIKFQPLGPLHLLSSSSPFFFILYAR